MATVLKDRLLHFGWYSAHRCDRPDAVTVKWPQYVPTYWLCFGLKLQQRVRSKRKKSFSKTEIVIRQAINV